MSKFPPLPEELRKLAVAWFRESDWSQWRVIDANFEPDYQHWLRRSEAALEHYQAGGHHVVKITIDPGEFIAWSRISGGKIDSGARSLFAAFKMEQQDGYH